MPHLLHNVDTILEGIRYTFCRTDNMLFAVLVEVDSLNGTARFPVLQHAFGTIAEGRMLYQRRWAPGLQEHSCPL